MTEKRFTIDRFDLLEYGEPVTVEEACDLLNKLSDENEQLKSELKALRKKYNDFYTMVFEIWWSND